MNFAAPQKRIKTTTEPRRDSTYPKAKTVQTNGATSDSVEIFMPLEEKLLETPRRAKVSTIAFEPMLADIAIFVTAFAICLSIRNPAPRKFMASNGYFGIPTGS